MKSPIIIFSLLLLVFSIYITFLPFWGLTFYAAVYFILASAGMILISLLLKFTKFKWRTIAEWVIILFFSTYVVFSLLNWHVRTELYFNHNSSPFTGKNQNFIIVFGIKNQMQLPHNWFTNNKIIIPENGVLLTSSSSEEYKWNYQIEDVKTRKAFTTNYFESCNCYGESNFQFEYLMGAINDSAVIAQEAREALLENICDQLDKNKIRSHLTSGYRNGFGRLAQTEIYLNNKNLKTIPKRLLSLKNLEYINIHSNNLRTIPEEVYQFPKLKSLYIGFNHIRTLPDKIGTIRSLERLAVNGNKLTDLPDTLLSLPDLKYLGVRENNFSEETESILYEKYKEKGIELQFR